MEESRNLYRERIIDLQDELNSVKREREEFKKLLFSRVGLIEEVIASAPDPEQVKIRGRVSVIRDIQRLQREYNNQAPTMGRPESAGGGKSTPISPEVQEYWRDKNKSVDSIRVQHEAIANDKNIELLDLEELGVTNG